MAKKKKLLTTVVAVATAAALLLSGTFAWQSINQTALNEASDVINPGGRLHDDFDGTNKDVYVENFADEDIFARIQLSEYFGIIANYGKEGAQTKTDIAGTATLDADGKIVNPTYAIHYFDQTNATADYWNWTTGGQTVFMPTFNMNKDSLVADINGTYVDAIGGISNRDGNQYTDYKPYAVGDPETGTEIYDGDTNMADEVGTALDNWANYPNNVVAVENATHTAKATGTGTLISMAEWLAMNGIQTTAASADDTNGVSPAFAENTLATLKYDKNEADAVGTIGDVEMPANSELQLSNGAGFSRPGYKLVGWNTAADGTGTTYDLGANYTLPEGETMLYAVWAVAEGDAEEPGYWVYDTDGWVYWSKPIKPGTATGLLLSGIELNQVMDDTWYYAINVVAQFVTADDVGKSDNTGFYDTKNGTAPTANAEAFLAAIGVDMTGEADSTEPTDPSESTESTDSTDSTESTESSATVESYSLEVENIDSPTWEGFNHLIPGDTVELALMANMSDGTQQEITEGVTWTVANDNTTEVDVAPTIADGVLTVGNRNDKWTYVTHNLTVTAVIGEETVDTYEVPVQSINMHLVAEFVDQPETLAVGEPYNIKITAYGGNAEVDANDPYLAVGVIDGFGVGDYDGSAYGFNEMENALNSNTEKITFASNEDGTYSITASEAGPYAIQFWPRDVEAPSNYLDITVGDYFMWTRVTTSMMNTIRFQRAAGDATFYIPTADTELTIHTGAQWKWGNANGVTFDSSVEIGEDGFTTGTYNSMKVAYEEGVVSASFQVTDGTNTYTINLNHPG